MRSRILFFLGKDISLSFENKSMNQLIDIEKKLIHNHELATLIMGDLEDILYSAMIRAMNELFRDQ